MDEHEVAETTVTGDLPPAYTIGTLVNDRDQYTELRQSFEAFGFDESDCEFLAIDNTGEAKVSPYLALNTMLSAARGDIVIFANDRVRLVDEGRPQLEACLDELADLDPQWAACSNVGGLAPGRLAIRISDTHGPDQRIGEFPAKVTSLDERFLVIRRASRAGFSHDLDGFELYGTDLCLIAEMMGLATYAIDFHIECMAPETSDDELFTEEKKFRDKWMGVMRSRFVQTPRRLLQIGSPGTLNVRGDGKHVMIGRFAIGRR